MDERKPVLLSRRLLSMGYLFVSVFDNRYPCFCRGKYMLQHRSMVIWMGVPPKLNASKIAFGYITYCVNTQDRMDHETILSPQPIFSKQQFNPSPNPSGLFWKPGSLYLWWNSLGFDVYSRCQVWKQLAEHFFTWRFPPVSYFNQLGLRKAYDVSLRVKLHWVLEPFPL